MTNQTNVIIPVNMRETAKKLQINISDVARRALAEEIERIAVENKHQAQAIEEKG
jgi:post-segregation antitoxin (ccd killing protein)